MTEYMYLLVGIVRILWHLWILGLQSNLWDGWS